MDTKNLIIICLTIIIIIGIVAFVSSNIFKNPEKTQITNLTKENITQGKALKLKLSDIKGNGINNQIIELNIIYKLNKSTYHNIRIKTNMSGECEVTNLEPGNYIVTAKYAGNNEYTSSNLTYNLKVKYKKNKKTMNPNKYATNYKADEVINGWDPSEHEVSREDIGDGNQRIEYDDGYFRVIDGEGNILSYGF